MSHVIDIMGGSRSFKTNPPSFQPLWKPPLKDKYKAASDNQPPQQNLFDQGMDLLDDTFTDARNEVVKLFSGAKDAFDTAGDRLRDTLSEVSNEVIETYSSTREAISSTVENYLGTNSPRELIDDHLEQLNSDGDSAVFRTGVKGQVSPIIPGLAVNGQYGYGVEVTQKGGQPPAGAVGDTNPAEYEVSFDKRLLSGLSFEDPIIPIVDGTVHAKLGSRDRVSMTFDTREEASQAVELLGRVAAAETVRDAGSFTPPIGFPLPIINLGSMVEAPRNPLAAENKGYNFASVIGDCMPKNPVETVFNMGADAIAPSKDEMAFLTDHISGYTTHLDAQAGLRFGTEASGIVGELSAGIGINDIADVARKVELPKDGQPGQVTYTLALKSKINSNSRVALGPSADEALQVNIGIQTHLDHAVLTKEVSMSWAYDKDEMGPTINGKPYPEVRALLQGQLGPPENITIRLDDGIKNQADWDLSRADFLNTGIELSVDQPGETSAVALQAALGGDVSQAMDTLGEKACLTITSQRTQRSGFDVQPGAKIKSTGLGVSASLIIEAGVDDVTRLDKYVIGGKLPEQPPTLPPVEASEPQAVPSNAGAELSDQVVVVPREGLALRDAPDGQQDSVFFHGTFLNPTGSHKTDAEGQGWTEINGLDVNDRPVTGWVSDAYIAAHPQGAMNDEGRINPDLEAAGYRAYRVADGDNIWDIAAANGCDFQETAALNANHLIDPSLIFEGDVVYLPIIDQ